MFTLIKTYAEVRNIELRDLFRSAHIKAFNHDIGASSLDEDVEWFKVRGIAPQYVIKFFLSILGGNHESKPSQTGTTDDDPVQALRRSGL